MGPKSAAEPKQEEHILSAVVVADNFNPFVFLHDVDSNIPLACRPLCNVPLINYTLTWLMRTTAVKRVFLVSDESKIDGLETVRKNWSLQFEHFEWIKCAGAKSVGDAVRELCERQILKGNFLLISNPATITNSILERQVAKYFEMRKKDKSNALNLLYVEYGKNNYPLALMRETGQLIAYHSPNNPHQLEGKIKESATVALRTDLLFSGIAICSENISGQFADNFDFETLEDVIGELFSKEDILGLNIHIDVMEGTEAAYCANDYSALVNLSQLVLERWFYPITPERTALEQWFTCYPGYVYQEEAEDEPGRLSQTQKYSPNSYQLGVAYGRKCCIDDDVELIGVVLGDNCTVGEGTSLRRCIIGRNCQIGKHCVLEELFIGDGVKIPEGTKITNRHAVIGNRVFYPSGLECPRNCFISTEKPSEEDDEDIKVREEKGIYIWNMKSGDDLWNGTKRRRRTTSGIESETQSLNQTPLPLDAAGDESDKLPTEIFYEEVIELMQRVLELEGPEGDETRQKNAKERMENLKLEFNSLRFANNVRLEDALRLSALAMLSFPQAQNLADLKKFFERWSHFFRSLYDKPERQKMILVAFEKKHKQATPEAPWLIPKAIKILVHHIYMEPLDLLGEEPILFWYDELEEGELKTQMKEIADWLEKQMDEEDSENSSDEESDAQIDVESSEDEDE